MALRVNAALNVTQDRGKESVKELKAVFKKQVSKPFWKEDRKKSKGKGTKNKLFLF